MRVGRPANKVPQGQRLWQGQTQVRPVEEDAPNQVMPPHSGGGSDDDEVFRPHDLLDGAFHLDTTAANVARGDLIYANSTPEWDRLAVGTANKVLKSDGTDPAWGNVAHSELSGTGSALLDGSRHSDTTASTPVRGDLIYANSTPAWDNLAVGTANKVLKSDGTDPAWGNVAHSELSGTGSALLDGAKHSDTTNSGPTRGDIIYANATPAWDDLAIGLANTWLKSDGTDPSWSAIGHTDLSGTGSALLDGAKHSDTTASAVTRGDLIYGNATPAWDDLALGAAKTVLRSDGTDLAWSTGDIDSNARVNVKKAGSSVGIRRGLNLIEGTNVTLTVTDDSGNEEVDVTINAATASGAAGQMLVGCWLSFDISGLSTTPTYDQLRNAWFQASGGVPQTHPEIAGRAGTLTLLTVTCDGDVDGAGVASITVEVYINGVASGGSVTLTGTTQAAVGTISEAVAATDLITVYATKSGAGVDVQQMSARVYLTPS